MSISPAFARAQSLRRFQNETPHQIAQHIEIARRYGRRRKKTFAKIVNLRRREITMFAINRYLFIPDNREGRRVLRVMIDHLAQLGPDHIRRWVNAHAWWIDDEELDEMIEDAGSGKQWSATALGKAIGLTNKERVHLDIRTIRPIDRSPALLKRDRKDRDAERKRQRRAEKTTPRPPSLEQAQPWQALGISRATYFRRKVRP
jgi:hypothetical protein